MKKKLVIGNLKMNIAPNELENYINNLKSNVNENNEFVLCMPYIDLPFLVNLVKNTNIHIGAQNMHYEEKGSYTGEISVKMLKSINTEYVILGHYERMLYFNEKNIDVNKKIKLALKYNIKPIVCIGSSATLLDEIKEKFNGLSKDDLSKIIIAYENSNSIGTGNMEETSNIDEKLSLINEIFHKEYNAGDLLIGYGGSINSSNINEIKNNSKINVFLVGSSSLDYKEFSKIINSVN